MIRHWIIICISLLLLIGCSEKTEEQNDVSATPTKQTEILLIMKSLTNPFFVEMEKGAREAAQELGFTLHVRSGTNESSLEQQAAFIEEYMQKGIQGIVIAPADSIRIIPVLKRAQMRGIKIVNIDNKIDAGAVKKAGMQPIPFISVDNEAGAYLSAKAIADQAPANTQAIIIEGIQSAANGQLRKNGALRAFKEAGISVVASESANWKIEEAYTLFSQLHAKHPEAKLVFCANDMMALGVLRYAQEQNLDDLLIAAYDDIPDAHKAIDEGLMRATINQQADQQGYFGARFAYESIQGSNVPLEKTVEVQLVTK